MPGSITRFLSGDIQPLQVIKNWFHLERCAENQERERARER